MPLLIKEVPSRDAPMALLLLADPSEEKIRAYLPGSRCFIASIDGMMVGACVVQARGSGVHELMSIAVDPSHQRSGYGSALLKRVIDLFHDAGARRLEVGTGTFGYQLAFYQRHGFRAARIAHDFFVRNYSEPVIENGMRHLDMLCLELDFAVRPANDSPGGHTI